jgi:hypothetical protein
MAEITPSRNNVQVEDVQFRASVSEAVGNKLGGSINFINDRQFDIHSWHLNGDFSVIAASEVGDGVFICQEDMEIVGLALYIGTNGSTGSNITVDLHWISSDGTDNGTIFSVKPAIATTAADGAFLHQNIRASDNEVPTGFTAATFSKTTFDRHDGIRLDLDSSTGGASNLQCTIFFRPR